MVRSATPLALATIWAVTACGDSPASPPYDPAIPASWAPAVTNPFFPLPPGTVWQYRSESSGGVETTITEVLDRTRVVHGVTAAVVRDRVLLDGSLIEDTEDWYAQDADGNVWYLGEDTKELDNGEVVSTEGSWEWGVAGALPGVNMWAEPSAHTNEAYRQEFLRGTAEDWGKVVAVGRSVTTALGDLTGCVETEDWSGLDPGTLERKTYCPGVGLVLEEGQGGERAGLVELTPSP